MFLRARFAPITLVIEKSTMKIGVIFLNLVRFKITQHNNSLISSVKIISLVSYLWFPLRYEQRV